jgi:hypothetical protein
LESLADLALVGFLVFGAHVGELVGGVSPPESIGETVGEREGLTDGLFVEGLLLGEREGDWLGLFEGEALG